MSRMRLFFFHLLLDHPSRSPTLSDDTSPTQRVYWSRQLKSESKVVSFQFRSCSKTNWKRIVLANIQEPAEAIMKAKKWVGGIITLVLVALIFLFAKNDGSIPVAIDPDHRWTGDCYNQQEKTPNYDG